MYNREDYKNKIQAMYDENNHITTCNLLDLIEEAIVDTTARPQEEFKQPTWNDFWDAACKECRDGMMKLADNLVEACETGRDNSPEWRNLYERVIKIRENMDDIPKDHDELGDNVGVRHILDNYGDILGCKRKENESNDVYRKRLVVNYNERLDRVNALSGFATQLDCSHNDLDEIATQWGTSQYEIDSFVKWANDRCSVDWSRKTALEQITNQTPLWREYVEDNHSE